MFLCPNNKELYDDSPGSLFTENLVCVLSAILCYHIPTIY